MCLRWWVVIINVGRKSLIGTVVENVVGNGCGGINVSDTEIPFVSDNDLLETKNKNRHADWKSKAPTNYGIYSPFNKGGVEMGNYNPSGRYPRNVIFSSLISDSAFPHIIFNNEILSMGRMFKKVCIYNEKENSMSEKPIPQDLIDYLHTMVTPTHVGGKCLIILEELNSHDFSQYEDEQWHSVIAQGTPTESVAKELLRIAKPGAHMMLIAPEDEPTGAFGACIVEDVGFEIRDSIFYARDTDPNDPNFMYMPKASRSEREKGTSNLNKVSGADAVGRKEGSDGMNSPRAGAGRTANKVGNFHPTVKPIGIMEWCLRDIPNGDLVIDPFLGSGTTGIACLKTGHNFIGIEMDNDYIQIADSRIRYWNTEVRGWNKAEIISDVEVVEEKKKEMSIDDLFGW